MRIIHEILCSKCGQKQMTDTVELWQENLFWRTCEFCHRYGLYRVSRQKWTSVREWMAGWWQMMACSVMTVEKSLSSNKEE